MSLTEKDVLHVARLARLRLGAEEVQAMTRHLGQILDYVGELSGVDTSDVEPTTYLAVDTAPLRADQPETSVAHDAVLDQAPRSAGGGFAVPGFVDGG